MKKSLQAFSHDGQDIFYMLEGSSQAPLVTLVNGYARTHTDFRIMSKKLVEAGFQVLSLDNRGSGKSVAHSEFTIQEMALDLIALWDYLEVNESYLLGVSMGGIISQYLASFDSRVEKLILVSTTNSKRFITPETVEFSSDFDLVHEKMKTYFHSSFVEKNGLLLEAMVKQMVKGAVDGDFVSQSKLQRAALNDFDLESSLDLSAIDLECMVVHGKQDAIISVDAAYDLCEKIRGAKSVIYDECGHLILAEKPLEFYQDVISFLKD